MKFHLLKYMPPSAALILFSECYILKLLVFPCFVKSITTWKNIFPQTFVKLKTTFSKGGNGKKLVQNPFPNMK